MSADSSESLTAAAIASHQAGDFAKAGALYARAIEADPRNARALHFLGLLKHQEGDHAGAEPLLRQALAIDPSKALYHATLGDVLRALGRSDEAVALLVPASLRFPDAPWVLHNLGFALLVARRPLEAIAPLGRSVELKPSANGMSLLGQALLEVGRQSEALPWLQRAAELDPAEARTRTALGSTWYGLGDIQKAEACYAEALRLDPKCVQAMNALADILRNNRGDLEGSVALYRRAMAAEPHWAGHHTNLLLALHYRSRWTPEEIFREHLAYAAAHADYPAAFVHAPRAPGARLRVGYVSGDFRHHAVASFFEPLVRHHDRGKVEVFCYSDVDFPDATTERLCGCAEHWRDIARLSNAQTADLVHQDRIDVLVDLSGHTGKARLKVFARKPAPVQATYLGYPDTTGLAAMDYRIVDAVTDPPGMTEGLHSERLLRLPGCFLAYSPPAAAPPVAEPPCLANGFVTFGSFNNFSKIGPEWVAWVSRILERVPGSRCLVKSSFFREGDGAKEVLTARFAEQGIGAERLVLRAADAGHDAHLARYAEMDIALDTWPYHGTTTTCEALWMGVPAVTLAGRAHVSRVGASLMTAVGLPDFVARTPEEFVDLAVAKAADPARLAEIRRTLRERMKPLTDGAAMAAKMEDALLRAFAAWNDSHATPRKGSHV